MRQAVDAVRIHMQPSLVCSHLWYAPISGMQPSLLCPRLCYAAISVMPLSSLLSMLCASLDRRLLRCPAGSGKTRKGPAGSGKTRKGPAWDEPADPQRHAWGEHATCIKMRITHAQRPWKTCGGFRRRPSRV